MSLDHHTGNARRHIPTLLLVVFIFCAMGAAQHLDNEHQTERLLEADHRQARIDAQFEARIDRAARDACASVVGPGSEPSWPEPGKLVCLAPLSYPIAQGHLQ